jgi:formyltetrahydrofolate synthetase
MLYTIYKITNLVNNKIYIGKHKTECLEDEYMGSGLILKKAIEKYGIDKFEKTILYEFDSEEKMNLMESEIVNDEFLARLDVYNLKKGGEGGVDYINRNCHNNKGNHRKTGNYGFKIQPEMNEEIKTKISEVLKEYFSNRDGNFKNKKHSNQTKQKISEINKIKQKGDLNSQFGKCWIHNIKDKISKSIKKEELDEWLNLGWFKGRKIKFD